MRLVEARKEARVAQVQAEVRRKDARTAKREWARREERQAWQGRHHSSLVRRLRKGESAKRGEEKEEEDEPVWERTKKVSANTVAHGEIISLMGDTLPRWSSRTGAMPLRRPHTAEGTVGQQKAGGTRLRSDDDWHSCFFHVRGKSYRLRLTKLAGNAGSAAVLQGAVSLTMTGKTAVNKEAWLGLESRLRHPKAASFVATSFPGDSAPGRDLGAFLRGKGVAGVCRGEERLE